MNIVGELPTANAKTKLSDIEGTFKDVTDGGLIPIERKHKDLEKAHAIARCVFAGNSLPYFSDKSSGLWDRLRIIPFNVRIRGTNKQNANLKKEIVDEEISGILNWALIGLEYLLSNNNIFPEAKEGLQIKEKHREDCDHERTFLLENYNSGNGFIECQLLYEKYKNWMRDNGYTSCGKQKFNRALTRVFDKVLKSREIINDNHNTKWINIKQKSRY